MRGRKVRLRSKQWAVVVQVWVHCRAWTNAPFCLAMQNLHDRVCVDSVCVYG